MAPQYKLSYFESRGLAEPIRFLMAYGGLEYEDIRISREQWPQFKAETPMGQMPLLEVVGGKTYHQNLAIARCIARKVGLAGKDDEENLVIDSVVDTINDLQMHLSRLYYEQNEEIKESLRKVFIEEKLPFYYGQFDKWAGENNGYLCLEKLTWADLYFTALESIHKVAEIDLSKQYKNLAKVHANVLANKNIQKWVATRPITEF